MNDIQQLVQLRSQIQKARIGFSNRLSAIERGADQAGPDTVTLFTRWHERLLAAENDVNEDICESLKRADDPVFDAIRELKGIGDITAAKIVSPINFERCNTVSALWRFAGYSVVEGRRERRVIGEKSHFSGDLKIAVRLCVESFLKARSPYAEIYYTEKERRTLMTDPATFKPRYTKMHAHNIAIGKTAKVFLAHLWHVGRILHGLPVRYPYAIDHLGHEHYLQPERFGWKLEVAGVQD